MSEYTSQFEDLDEHRNRGGLSWRLFESQLRVVVYPVFVVALDREINVKAARRSQ